MRRRPDRRLVEIEASIGDPASCKTLLVSVASAFAQLRLVSRSGTGAADNALNRLNGRGRAALHCAMAQGNLEFGIELLRHRAGSPQHPVGGKGTQGTGASAPRRYDTKTSKT